MDGYSSTKESFPQPDQPLDDVGPADPVLCSERGGILRIQLQRSLNRASSGATFGTGISKNFNFKKKKS